MSQQTYHLGQRIESILHKQGMSKAEFGRRIATSRQNINGLLRKQALPTDQLMLICRVLNHNLFEELAGMVPREASPGVLPTSAHSEVLISMRKRPETSFLQIVEFLKTTFPHPPNHNSNPQQAPLVLDRIYFGLGQLGLPDLDR